MKFKKGAFLFLIAHATTVYSMYQTTYNLCIKNFSGKLAATVNQHDEYYDLFPNGAANIFRIAAIHRSHKICSPSGIIYAIFLTLDRDGHAKVEPCTREAAEPAGYVHRNPINKMFSEIDITPGLQAEVIINQEGRVTGLKTTR